MLEKVLSKCVMHYLKEYLKPLEPGQMELKIFQGSLQLYNLQLLPTALTAHHIPFLIRKGSVKHLKAIFPWKNLKNSACEVLIEDMFIVLQFASEIILKSDVQADQKSIPTKGETSQPSKDDQSKVIQGFFESIIDNLKVLIKNIHIRIEFPCDPLPIVIGLSTPEISINTVDDKDQVITTIQHPLFLRKQLLIKDFSIYFDTNKGQIQIKDDSKFQTSTQAVEDFTSLMRAIMKEDHQYLFNPTTFKSIMIHTKDKNQTITNKIETTIDKILINLDLLQCRSIIQLNTIWSQFLKRRKYVNCIRPISFNNLSETWKYAHKCAIVKIQPYVFKPYLALMILKNKNKYIELFKQAKVSKLSASLLGSPKQKLDSLEKKVGKTATIYLRELAEAIYVKEESMKDSSDMTAFDLSELKSIFESTELVFSMRQFSAAVRINSFNLELLYIKGSPLVSVNCQNLDGKLISLPDGVNMNLSLKDTSITSYINDVSRNIFKTANPSNFTDSNFIHLNCIIPTTGDVSSIDCSIAPIKVTLDTETINNILEFFTVQNKAKIDTTENKVKTVRLDIGEQLQGFKILRNYKMFIKMDQLSFNFPFKSDNNKVKYLTFEMGNITFAKNLISLLPKSSPEIPMNFDSTFNLKVKVDTFTLLTSDDIKANVNLVLINGKFGVNILAKIDLPTLQVFIAEQSYSVISFAVSNLLAIPFMHSDVISNSTQQVLMAGRSKMGCEVKLKALNIFLNDDNIANEMKITIADLAATAQYYASSFQATLILNDLHIIQFSKTFIEILDKIDIRLDKRTDQDPLLVDTEVNKPHVYMNFDTINWIMIFSSQLIDFLPKKIEPIETPDLQVKVTKESDPPKFIVADSILTQSIDSFIDQSGNLIDFVPHFRNRRTSSLHSDSSCEDLTDIVQEDVSNSTRLNLNVVNVLLEMFDADINSFFKIESVSISDPSSSGFVLSLKKFSISRNERYILKPVDLQVPIYLPDPIRVTVEFAESELFADDINALNVYSPQIFKLMFGGSKPLIKDQIEVNAFAKKGIGYLINENHQALARATVEDVSLYIKITSTALTVDVKVPTCNGFYTGDDYAFLSMDGEYHCTYIGTMNDQDILIEVPTAEIFLRSNIVDWVVGFIPPPPDESELQPLKIKLAVEPGKINFLSTEKVKCIEKVNSSEKVEYIEKVESVENDVYLNFFSIVLGNANCLAFRDGSLDLDLDVDGVGIASDLFDHPIFELAKTHFTMTKTLLKSEIPSIEINVPIEHLPRLISEVTSFIPKGILTSPQQNDTNSDSKLNSDSNTNSDSKLNSDSNSLSSLNFGIDFVLNKLSVSVYPEPKKSLRLEIPGIKFMHNPSYSITGIEISSILLYTVYHTDDPTLILNLSKIESILTFSENTDFDLSQITFDSIAQLPQKETEKQPLTNLFFSYKMDLIQVNYNHFFAQVLADSIFKSMANFESLPKEQAVKIDSLLNIGIHIDCAIEKIEINFVIIDPFASVTFTKIKLNYNEKCEASVKDLTVLPISKDERLTVKRSLITKKDAKDDLLSITIQNGELYAILAECDFYIDLTLLLNLAKFLFTSPLLNIKPLTVSEKEEKSFSKALPFTLILKLMKVDISVPITLENDNIHELQVHITSLINITSSSLSVNMSSLSLNFYETISKTVFPSILSDFAVHFSIEIEEDSSFSLKANILDIYTAFSAADIFLFSQFGTSITKAMNSLIFTVEETQFDIFDVRISNIEIISANMTYVLCKDNRSCSQIIPIFQVVVPPILFKVKKTSSSQISEKPPVEIDIQPYIEYFNELTGNFDLIIEPFNLQLCANLTEEQMTFGVNVLSNININLPLSAILKMKDMVDEIKESVKNQKTLKYSQLPSMWLCNKLGSFVAFTIGDTQLSLGHDCYIPLFGVNLTTTIKFSIDDLDYSIVPNSFNYPTYLSRTILVVKEPYKGGLMISFERTFQVENNLNFDLKMFSYDSLSKKYHFVCSIEPHKRQPLIFEKEITVLLLMKNAPNNLKHSPIKLSLLDKSTAIFTIMCDERKTIQCVKTVYNDTKKAVRVISISSQYLLKNLLPYTLFCKTDMNEIMPIKRGEIIDFYNIENETFSAFLSLSDKIFLKNKSTAKIDYKNTAVINVFNPEVRLREKCLIDFSFEKEISQTTITLYMPIVIYNMTMYVLDFECQHKSSNSNNNNNDNSNRNDSSIQNINDISSKSNINNNNNNYSPSMEVLPNSKRFWCPPTFTDHSSNDTCMVTVFARGNSKNRSKPFDCLSTGHDTLFLPSLDGKDLFVPIRYNTSNHNRTLILTFSPLITVSNRLDVDFVLTPIHDIPTEISGQSMVSLINGSATLCHKFGSPLKFPAKSEIMVPYIPKNGTFSISIDGYSTTPCLSLLEQQKTVFKVQNQKNCILIELQVTDIGTGIHVEFKDITFPTPIIINNQLDISVMAFQIVFLTPFEILPHSTSIFAFDEPFFYPSVTLSFGLRNVYRISLVEDTERVEMKRKYKDRPVYVQVKHNKNGNKIVIISQEEEEHQEKYRFVFESSIYGIAASLIDLQTREIALVYLSHLKTKFTFNNEYLAVSLKLKSLQIDDQNPLAPHPTIVYGYFTDTKPYLSVECLCPIDSKLFTSFDYLAINMQRIDIDADCSFISDWINLGTSLDLKTIHSIRPKKPSILPSNLNSLENGNSNDGLITLRWFEITPTYIVLRYHRKTSRPPMVGKVPGVLKFIPGINSGKILLPGIIISHLTDRLGSIATKLTGDYKTAVFKEILRMLGSAGKILRGLGIASAIASSLDISTTSDMTSEISLNSIVKNKVHSSELINASTKDDDSSDSSENLSENSSFWNLSEYDNRIDDDELSSCFSYEALSSLLKKINKNSIEASPFIQFTVPKFSMINDDSMSLLDTNTNNQIDYNKRRKLIIKKLLALQKAKNDAIEQTGLKMKTMPGFGYGRGVAGVLTKELNDPLKNVDVMAHCKRVRETRPYAGAKISHFNPAIARAQSIIFKSGGLNEKVKEICPTIHENKKCYILMTENSLYLFDEDLNAFIGSIKFNTIQDVHIDKTNTNLVLKLTNGKKVSFTIESQICLNFLCSLLRMNRQFEESLLL